MKYNNEELEEILKKVGCTKEDYKKCKNSVSKVVESFKTPFDQEASAKRCYIKYFNDPKSQYYHKTVEEILQIWENSRIDTTSSGKLLDFYIGSVLEHQDESYMKELHEQMEEAPEHWRKKLDSFNAFMKGNLNETNGNFDLKYMSREKDLCYPPLNIRGRFDAIFVRESSEDFTYPVVYLFDWKNSKEIATYSKYKQKLHGPLSEYDDCELNNYTIQLYIYKYILRKVYDIENEIQPFIIHVTETGVKAYKPVIPYSDKLVEEILEYANNVLSGK